MLYADFDGPMVSDAWRIYQDVGAAIAKQVMASSTLKTNFITCDPSASGCLMQTIQTFGRKAFRRPLTTDEVTRFMALGHGDADRYAGGGGRSDAVRLPGRPLVPLYRGDQHDGGPGAGTFRDAPALQLRSRRAGSPT